MHFVILAGALLIILFAVCDISDDMAKDKQRRKAERKGKYDTP